MLCVCCFGKVDRIGNLVMTDFLSRMRGWVGVQKRVKKKMTGLLTAHGFQGIFDDKPSALLSQTGFQLFVVNQFTFFSAIISSSAI
jgi:hypothetical protein